jgi:hypothetical protein
LLPLQRRSRSGHSPHATRVRAGCPGRHPDRHATGHAHARRPTRLATQRRRGAARRASPRTQPDPPAPRGDTQRHDLYSFVIVRRSPVHRARRLPACRDHRADRAPRGKYQVHGDTTKSKTIKTCVSLPTPAHTATHAAAALRRRCRTSGRPLRSTRLSSLVRSTSSLDGRRAPGRAGRGAAF